MTIYHTFVSLESICLGSGKRIQEEGGCTVCAQCKRNSHKGHLDFALRTTASPIQAAICFTNAFC